MSITSPTFSSVSDDSFHHLTLSHSSMAHSRLDPDASSDDEIVWSVSEADLSSSASMISLASPYPSSLDDSEDEDYVVLSRNPAAGIEDARVQNASTPCITTNPLLPGTANLTPETLAQEMEHLSLEEREVYTPQEQPKAQSETPSTTSKKRRPRRRRNTSTSQPKETVALPSPPAHSDSNKKKSCPNMRSSTGFGDKPIDDLSDGCSEAGAQKDTEEYKSAVKFIDSFLSNPSSNDRTSRLTLLQSMIIELGLASAYSAVPASLRAATTLLKSTVFVNIREYLAVRSQGPEALQKVMYPSKSALVRDMRRRRAYAPLKYVKASGLSVLLVPCHF